MYTPLESGSIRILQLLPGLPSSIVRCTLTTIFLSNAESQYKALSYVWGLDEPSHTIELNGKSFPVRANLYAALQALRHGMARHSPRSLWIDAICIDQTNVTERSEQVAIMGTIYRNAKAVVSWLGEETEGVAMLFEALTKAEGDLYHDNLFRDDSPRKKLMSKLRIGKHPYFPSTVPAFADFFLALCSRPYWKRVWIIQEVLSASRVMLQCGNSSLLMDYFVEACLGIRVLSHRTTGILNGMSVSDEAAETAASHISKQYQQRHQGWVLQRLVALCASCKSECQDPRDRIYGILSLASDSERIVPDYTKSLLQLYLEVICSDLSDDWIFMIAQHNESILQPYADETLGLEYVLPDANIVSAMLDPLGMNSFKTTRSTIFIHPSDIITNVSGATIPNISEKETTLEGSIKWDKRGLCLQRSTHEWDHCICRSTRPDLDYDGDLEPLWKRHSSYAAACQLDLDAEMEYLGLKHIKQLRRESLPGQGPIVSDTGIDKNSTNLSDSQGRKFFTLNGVLGIGYADVAMGDILCHVNGTDRELMIVRRSKSNGDDGVRAMKFIGRAMILDRKMKASSAAERASVV